MITIRDITDFLEGIAPQGYQESYDNSGLITGQASWNCTGVLISLDATEEVILEAASRGVNLVVAHHPVIFKGLKKLNGNSYVEKAVIAAIKNDVAIYAIHTNLDNIKDGVSGKMASLLGLENVRVLEEKTGTLSKLYTYVPVAQKGKVLQALFDAGAGRLGNYSECSFSVAGTGTFKANDEAQPFVGKIGERHLEEEVKIEVILPGLLERKVVRALKQSHPYEEVAYELIRIANPNPEIGSGAIGELAEPLEEGVFLTRLKEVFNLRVIRHTPFTGKPVKRVALCGGAGSFLISTALGAGADIFITGDVKYHEFFDAEGKMVIADIGHFESEQFTIDMLYDILLKKFPTFAVLKSGVKTNPVQYFI
ncbi:MAG TPA: Nif3-like dinuclear metal center hexameric protein [Parasegetibacter sp.]